MKWIDKFVGSIDEYAGEAVRKEVFKITGKLKSNPNPSQRAIWIKKAMETLEGLVDEETMKKILTATCPHNYPKGRIQKLKKKYEKLGDIDKLIEIMKNDRSWKGTSYYDNPVRKGNSIYITKVARDPQAYQSAKTDRDKKLAYCHCPWIKASISEQEKVTPLFCYCATGWDKQLWEGILDKPVKVEVVKSLLKGDECCTHVIHLPSDTV